METQSLSFILSLLIGTCLVFYSFYKLTNYAFVINSVLIVGCQIMLFWIDQGFVAFAKSILFIGCPLILSNVVMYVFANDQSESDKTIDKYKVRFKVSSGNFQINNIKRGASIIGSAGSGKTESVVFNFLQHFSKYSFCGVIHDYKNFELTELAYPLFKSYDIPFHIISFDTIYHRVNPIAPRYMENEESVNEVSRVLIENLLEQRESGTTGATKFFNDAAEGLIGGLIWKLKTDYPKFCTLPHLIAIYQFLETDSLIAFLKTNMISCAMADAFDKAFGDMPFFANHDEQFAFAAQGAFSFPKTG